MSKTVKLGLLAVMLLIACQAMVAASWNVADQWYWKQARPEGNPWQYGYTDDDFVTPPWYLLPSAWCDTWLTLDRWAGYVNKSTGGTYWDGSTLLEDGKVYLRGLDGNAGFVVWESPISGNVRVQGSFAGSASDYDLNGYPVKILLNKVGTITELFSDTVVGFVGYSTTPAAGSKPVVNFDLLVYDVAVGDKIFFGQADGGGWTPSGVEWGPGTREHVRFDATISTCMEKLRADITGDCVVDINDLAELAADWLVDNRVY